MPVYKVTARQLGQPQAASDVEDADIATPCCGRSRAPLVPLFLALLVFSLLLLPSTAKDRMVSSASQLAEMSEWHGKAVDTAVAAHDNAAVEDADHKGLASRLDAPAFDTGLVVQKRQLLPQPFQPFQPAPRKVLECFETKQPVLVPSTDSTRAAEGPYTTLLMEHVFAYSYGAPFIGNYTPPNCDFNRVVMNFTVVSAGRQFDRLALMYLGDTEVWRTSTAEPVRPPGIHWEYHKDMTQFLSLWKQPQTLVFDLGNLINVNYTASFNTTLTATFFTDDVDTATAPPANLIIPISGLNVSRSEGAPAGSVFVLPKSSASRTVGSFPRNANRAVLSIQSNGQANEEFWWSNYLQSDVAVFNSTFDGMAPGMSPFREVTALIDGKIAGVQWPFPVIFTGGVVPTFHRPVVGLQAFDMREHQIDITPWLPLLCDGKPHTFSFLVSGLLDSDGKTAVLSSEIDDNWPVTGKIFVWLDDEGSITTGSTPEIQGEGAFISISHETGQDSRGRNQTLNYSVAVKRQFSVTATVKTQKTTVQSVWRQQLSYDNKNQVANYGLDQNTTFTISGSDNALADNATVYGQDYSYPLVVDVRVSQAQPSGVLTLDASMYQGMTFQTAGMSVFPDGLEVFAGTKSDRGFKASVLSTYRSGTANFQSSTGPARPSTGSGSIRQEFAFGGNFDRYPDISMQTGVGPQPDEMLYYRNLTVTRNVVTRDRETIADRTPANAQALDGGLAVEMLGGGSAVDTDVEDASAPVLSTLADVDFSSLRLPLAIQLAIEAGRGA